MIQCIIVEDELLARQVIESHLARIPELQLVGVCQNAVQAQALLEKTTVDLIFLDLELPGIHGLSFLRSVPDPPLVIITTAYAQFALESYEFNVIDYLLKPVSFERFSRAIDKLTLGRLASQPTPENENWGDHLFVKSGSKFFRVNFSEIIYVQGMRDYLKIHTREMQLITHQTMNEFEKMLPARQFIRIHKSYIVAIHQIKIVYGNAVDLGGINLPIGNSYKNDVMALIGKNQKSS